MNKAKLPFPIQKPQIKASQALPLMATYNAGQAVWNSRDTAAFIDDGYMKNWVLFTAVNDIATSAAAIPLNVYKRSDDSELIDHPVLRLLRRPSPFTTDVDFFTAAYAYFKIAGNSYLEWSTLKEDGEGTLPEELYVLPPTNMKVIAGRLYVAGYEFDFNGQKKRYDYDIIKHQCRILHWKTFHPKDNWYGMSACEAAAISVDTHNQASEWNKALLDNGARPSGALVYSPKGEDSDDTLTDDQYKTLSTRMEENWSGAANRGRPILLEGGLQWQQMSLTPSDLDFLAGKNTDAIGIAKVLDYPPFLLGLDTGQATFNNVEEAKVSLYEEGILPMIDSMKKKLTNWFAPYFGDDWYIDYDEDAIKALQPKRDKIWARMEKASWITVNEKREATRFEPIDDGDVILVPSMQMPLGEMLDPKEPVKKSPIDDDDDKTNVLDLSTKNFAAWMYEMGYGLQLKNKDTTELKKQLQLQNRFIKGFEPRMISFLNKQAKAIAAGYAKDGTAGAKKALKDSEPEMKKLLSNLYKKVMPAAGGRILEALLPKSESEVGIEEKESLEVKEEALSIFEMTVSDWIKKHSAAQVQNISAFTTEKVRTILLEASAEGEGTRAIAAKIREALGEEASKARANTIARTEVHQSYNVAADTAAKATGLKMQKKWLSTNDDRTRDSHRAAHALQVQMKEKFDVGGSKLLYPGDPNGDPGETINCRCGIRHIPMAEDSKPKPTAASVVKPASITADTPYSEISSRFDTFGLSTPENGYDFKHSNEKMFFKRMTIVANDLDRVIAKNSKLAKILKSKSNSDIYLDDVGMYPNGDLGSFSVFGKEIKIAAKKVTDRDAKVSLGKWNAVNDGKGTVRHELGHSIYLNTKFSDGTWLSKRWREAAGDTNIGKSISKYADGNMEEAFCEAFSAWTSPNYSTATKKLPAKIEKLFNEVFR